MTIRRRSRLTGVTNTLRKIKTSFESDLYTIPTFVGCTSHQLYGVNGTIVAETTDGTPVPHAKIRIDDEYIYDNIITDSEGKFSIKGLISGNHKVDISCDGFLNTTYAFNIPKNSTSINIDLPNMVLVQDIGQRNKIRGVFVGGNGLGAKINLYLEDTLVQSLICTDNYTFTLEPLVLGNYKLEVQKTGFETNTQNITLDTYSKDVSITLVPANTPTPPLNESINDAVNNLNIEPVEVHHMNKINSLSEAKELLYSEGDTRETNPLYFTIEDFYTEVNSNKTEFERDFVNNIQRIETTNDIPYIYVVDFGKEDASFNLQNSLMSSLELYSTYEDTNLFVICGLDNQNLAAKAEAIDEMVEFMDELWTIGKTGNILVSFKGQTENLPTEFKDDPKFFNKNLHIGLEYEFLGHYAGRFCLTPSDQELGFIPFRSLEIEDITRRTNNYYLTARDNGLMSINVQKTSYGKYPRIELGVNTLYAQGEIVPESKVYIKRVIDSILNKVDNKCNDYIKMKDTTITINLLNTDIKRIISRAVEAGLLDDSSAARVVQADKRETDVIVELKLVGTPLLENIEVSVTVGWAENSNTRYYSLV